MATDPSVVETSLYPDDQSWKLEGDPAPLGVTLDISALTAGTHYPNGFIPSGTPIGLLAGGNYGVYDNTDPAVLLGFLNANVDVRTGSTGDHAISVMQTGKVLEDQLPATWSGQALAVRTAGKADVAAHILFPPDAVLSS